MATSAAESARRRTGKLAAALTGLTSFAAAYLAIEDIHAIAEVNHKVRVDRIGPSVAPHLSCDAPTHVALPVKQVIETHA